MAEEKDDIEITEDGGGKSKKMIIIAAVAVLALAGGGTAFFLGGDESATEEITEAAPVAKQTPIYYSVADPFITNFSEQSQGAVRYMQIKLKVMARDQQIIDAFKLHLPAIQHELLLLFHGQNYDELTAGTKDLQKTTLNKINAVLKSEKLPNKIEAVYFTSFLMQ
ncbi:MAG: flagellar basal body protein FliL [Gammaproteobacteria bacterium]|nr:MAG: flagellar basal body protein FliL [Gammaproteobacteria bacterium]RKZ95710.1 MAG: flagellar basal body protein FliL [Gammaproteobacteria bacterium]RKZ96478.1 MAG: flagellar basal body protein FliL [Gammaproteobacteria bacterium]RLA00401.1 MAG: flagellar basal body protein FliL [Gammaproteobacteria bacterium]HHA18888.1 flagellar basal body protein FliL [Methylophaga sp.]